MSTQTLVAAIELATALSPEEQQLLHALLADSLAADPRHPIQIAGSLGSALDPSEGDPVAEALDDLRRERDAHLGGEW